VLRLRFAAVLLRNIFEEMRRTTDEKNLKSLMGTNASIQKILTPENRKIMMELDDSILRGIFYNALSSRFESGDERDKAIDELLRQIRSESAKITNGETDDQKRIVTKPKKETTTRLLGDGSSVGGSNEESVREDFWAKLNPSSLSENFGSAKWTTYYTALLSTDMRNFFDGTFKESDGEMGAAIIKKLKEALLDGDLGIAKINGRIFIKWIKVYQLFIIALMLGIDLESEDLKASKLKILKLSNENVLIATMFKESTLKWIMLIYRNNLRILIGGDTEKIKTSKDAIENIGFSINTKTNGVKTLTEEAIQRIFTVVFELLNHIDALISLTVYSIEKNNEIRAKKNIINRFKTLLKDTKTLIIESENPIDPKFLRSAGIHQKFARLYKLLRDNVLDEQELKSVADITTITQITNGLNA